MQSFCYVVGIQRQRAIADVSHLPRRTSHFGAYCEFLPALLNDQLCLRTSKAWPLYSGDNELCVGIAELINVGMC